MQELARNRRKNQTDAEIRMWYYLRNRRLGGHKFVREQVIGHYIADFVCRESKLIIEVDGGQHMAAEAYDQQRTKDLEAVGYRVMRVWNNEVFSNIQGVLDRVLSLIEGALDKKPSSCVTGT
ncbi:putative restriction endonuclease-like [Legionella quateirensis]|uniref:Multidrug efflux protein n=2 Tax=Legionella quateirensis TaxID=45072 RepID=A0A378KVV4_9GAMM|nr:multidrug efflux protein [Legionella quateirensis]STY18309.1 putative restriction endonuclease-like [Legionella quateirensis]